MPPNTFQWYRNGQPINGATQPGFDAVIDGSYLVQVDNGGTMYTSDSVTVVVNPLPAVSYTVDASQDTVCLNSAVITLTGAAPPTGIFLGDAVDSAGNFNPSAAVSGPNIVTYSVTNVYGCTATVSQTIIAKLCTGIEVTEAGLQVNIYPNPASTSMSIETDSKLIGGSVEVYDVLGNVVAKETITNVKSNLSVANFASGLYNIRLYNASQKQVAAAKISVAH
jgi:hypothetical protein